MQLLKISSGDEDVGYLYNFVHNKIVYAYQSGFIYIKQAKYKPGLVSHYLAIQYNIQVCNDRYDFLAGDNQYKRSMSTSTASMYWLIIQRPSIKYFLEEMSIKMKNILTVSKN